MTKTNAQKLHNRDQVEVLTEDGWEYGYVLGEPQEVAGRVIIPVQTDNHGYRQVDHVDVR